jgi:predicted RNA methylase
MSQARRIKKFIRALSNIVPGGYGDKRAKLLYRLITKFGMWYSPLELLTEPLDPNLAHKYVWDACEYLLQELNSYEFSFTQSVLELGPGFGSVASLLTGNCTYSCLDMDRECLNRIEAQYAPHSVHLLSYKQAIVLLAHRYDWIIASDPFNSWETADDVAKLILTVSERDCTVILTSSIPKLLRHVAKRLETEGQFLTSFKPWRTENGIDGLTLTARCRR